MTPGPLPADAATHDRQDLITDHLAIAYDLADRYATEASHEDLLQVAALALVGSAGRFDPEHAGSFQAFAVTSVLGELRNHLRDGATLVRIPRAASDRGEVIDAARARLEIERGAAVADEEVASVLGCDVDEVRATTRSLAPPVRYPSPEEIGVAEAATDGAGPLEVDPGDDPGTDPRVDGSEVGGVPPGSVSDPSEDEALARVEDHHALVRALAALGDADRDLLRRRFVEDRTQTEIATDLGISQVHVSRRLREVLGQLRTTMTGCAGAP